MCKQCAKVRATVHQITNASDNKELALQKLKSFIHMKMHLAQHSGNHRAAH